MTDAIVTAEGTPAGLPAAPVAVPATKPPGRYPAVLATLALLGERFPAVFIREWRAPVKPLAVGIHKDLIERLPDIEPGLIRSALRLYQDLCRPSYWMSLTAGSPRFDLDGNERGKVTERQAAHAANALAVWQAKRKMKQQAKLRTKQQLQLPVRAGQSRAPRPQVKVQVQSRVIQPTAKKNGPVVVVHKKARREGAR